MPVRRVIRALSTLLVAAGLALGALMVVPALAGIQRYVITSGSMTGTYDRGSLVLDEIVPVRELRAGDVITYLPPPGSGPDHLITHRIASIGRDPSGARVFRTKGDANATADPWTFRLGGPTQARVRVGVPYAGFVLSALARRDVRTAVIALPALLIALVTLAGLWRQLGEAAGTRERAA